LKPWLPGSENSFVCQHEGQLRLGLLVVFAFAFGEVAGVMDLAVDGFGVVDGFAVMAMLAALLVVYGGSGHV